MKILYYILYFLSLFSDEKDTLTKCIMLCEPKTSKPTQVINWKMPTVEYDRYITLLNK